MRINKKRRKIVQKERMYENSIIILVICFICFDILLLKSL